MSELARTEHIFNCGFSWLDHEPGKTWWADLDVAYRTNLGRVVVDNKIPEILVPMYQERKWMPPARIDAIIGAKDSIGSYIDWNNSTKRRKYWLKAYTKLHIMENHLRIYMVMRRLR